MSREEDKIQPRYPYDAIHQEQLECKYARPRPEQPPPKSASERACDEILDRFLVALNAQDFSLDTWNDIAPNLRVAWGVLKWQEDRDKDMPLAEWLEAMREFARKMPHYRFSTSNITTVVDEQAGTAESLMNVQSYGMFPGVQREAVSGFFFVRTNGEWEAIRHGAFPGWSPG